MPFEDYIDGAAYTRVSSGKQEELSPAAQKRLLLDYAKKHKILIRPEHIFMENGISGRNAQKRPEFQKMIALAKQKPSPFQVILVWKFSRFARNQEESIVYKSMLKKQCHVEVISITEPLIDGPFGSLIERIIEWMDEYYSINLSGETLRGMTENALRGGYQSTPCLGYAAVGNGQPFVVVKEEKTVVQFIFEKFCYSYMEPTAIARVLNEKGIKTKRGGLFEKRSVTYILRNQFYIGKISWNGVEHDGTHETFISQELFDLAQERLNSTFKPKKRRDISECKHWASGLVKCSICGATLSYNKCRYPFFNCWKYSKGFHKETSSISEKNLVKGILDYFEKLLDGEDFSFHSLPASEPVNLQENYEDELKKLDVREQRVRLAYENGIDSLQEYRENKIRLQAERRQLQELQNACKEPEPISKADFLEKIHTVYDILKDDGISYEIKGTFLRSVVEEIIYDKEKNSLAFHLYRS